LAFPEGYKNFIGLRDDNPCVKLLLGIGGWREGSEKYSLMAESDETRFKFADHIMRYITHYGFDGIDLDWEYPTTVSIQF
jgi:chitinase